ncbi:proton extrusion protein PcxA [Myxacorys almedinensis]|nr:proton extrusion protein PcxA [Myxacorys almedinensis]
MRTSIFAALKGSLRRAEQWYLQTPDRALDLAYDAALNIKAIEDEHFGGKKIARDAGTLSASAFAYFEADLRRHLRTIRMRLTEFRRSRSTLNVTNPNKVAAGRSVRTIETTAIGSDRFVPTVRDQPAIALEKLKFIDSILARYAEQNLTLEAVSTSMISQSYEEEKRLSKTGQTPPDKKNAPANPNTSATGSEDFESITDKTGLLPRSILTTLSRLKRDLDPNSETEVVQTYRVSKVRTLISVRFILTLILVPLLVQQGVRNLVLTNSLPPGQWISQQFSLETPERVFLNSEMTEEALHELQRFEERLRFENLIKETLDQREFSPAEVEERAIQRSEVVEAQLKEKAIEVAANFSVQSTDAIKNWVADIAAAIAFALVLTNSKREVEVVKSVIDEVAYGLSDSAKAFVIILFTDVFVGFHSPHGWEVLLDNVARHFGLPTSRDFSFLFIATFPVILDTIFKYWIFRYLNRVSPSAVATYREMNE